MKPTCSAPERRVSPWRQTNFFGQLSEFGFSFWGRMLDFLMYVMVPKVRFSFWGPMLCRSLGPTLVRCWSPLHVMPCYVGPRSKLSFWSPLCMLSRHFWPKKAVCLGLLPEHGSEPPCLVTGVVRYASWPNGCVHLIQICIYIYTHVYTYIYVAAFTYVCTCMCAHEHIKMSKLMRK